MQKISPMGKRQNLYLIKAKCSSCVRVAYQLYWKLHTKVSVQCFKLIMQLFVVLIAPVLPNKAGNPTKHLLSIIKDPQWDVFTVLTLCPVGYGQWEESAPPFLPP